MRLWWKIKNILWEIKNRMQNYILVKKYPWLHPIIVDPNSQEYHEIRDPKYNYSYVLIFNNYKGWWKAFGKLFCDEIQAEFPNCPGLYVIDYKEKWGRLDIYFGGANKKILDICNKYSYISEGICYFCGKPDVHMTNAGWLLPICKECYTKHKWSNKSYEEVIPDNDPTIPNYYTIRESVKGAEWAEHNINISKTIKRIRDDYQNRQSIKRFFKLGQQM